MEPIEALKAIKKHQEFITKDNPELFKRSTTWHIADKALREYDGGWISAKDKKPATLKPVLVVLRRGSGKVCVLKAEYVAPNSILEEDYINEEWWGEGLSDYDEDKDCYWVKENWFECNWYGEYSCVIADKVISWKLLPQPPQEAE